ncbi:hypothetical protein [Methylobacterium gregans]|uniref:Uncharacterized protein n=1 Tax=Methylobacterium gregans TaxID=374424 RepID=A0AA37HNF1_9HYPH|nr:hypothetical protein [Methylobacterium gregans]MDQ0521975.1 hypothetical protein [Methylobacterium gregans]GJD77992.1 hypothetical protein NBEOAGPD_1204 [Methylobacterium gregans]GLS51961.1 hypothetical protein GCM10007886_01430 [Methylobacterium gregans]
MTARQRSALVGMMDAILAVDQASVGIRARAQDLRDRLDQPTPSAIILIFRRR